jgi:hypothetical protein
VSANAKELHPYGAFIASVTPSNFYGNLGDAVAAVRAGQVPDALYANDCN